MNSYVIVALGAGLGGALRHAVNVVCARVLGTGWPYGTFVINVVGSFAIGVVVGWFALRGRGAHAWLLFLTTGVLGGFTTFSAFSLEVVLLYERGHLGLAALYLGGSVALAIAAVFVGMALVRQFT
jgi:CrcB protein